jgi:hypothetical protein
MLRFCAKRFDLDQTVRHQKFRIRSEEWMCLKKVVEFYRYCRQLNIWCEFPVNFVTGEA